MILFTTPKCSKCQLLNEIVNLHAIGIHEIVLSEDNVDALVELAWYGLVDEAKKTLPILVYDGGYTSDFKEIVKIICDEIQSIINLRSTNKNHSLTEPCTDAVCAL